MIIPATVDHPSYVVSTHSVSTATRRSLSHALAIAISALAPEMCLCFEQYINKCFQAGIEDYRMSKTAPISAKMKSVENASRPPIYLSTKFSLVDVICRMHVPDPLSPAASTYDRCAAVEGALVHLLLFNKLELSSIVICDENISSYQAASCYRHSACIECCALLHRDMEEFVAYLAEADIPVIFTSGHARKVFDLACYSLFDISCAA